MFQPGVRPTNFQVVANDCRFPDLLFEKPEPLHSPFPPLSPKVEFPDGDIGKDDNLVLDVSSIKVGSGVFLRE